MSSDQVYRCCLRVFRGHWSRNVSSRRKCDCFSGCFIRIEIEKPHKVITCREYSKISFHNIKVQRVRKCWCSLKTGESNNNKHRKNCECCPGHSLRDGVKKSKWKFKMAFAIRGPTPPPPPLMAQISRHFFTPLFSFAIESYIYETDFTLQKYHF